MSTSYTLSIFRMVTEGFALVLVGIFGIVGNLSLIFWFISKKNNFHQLMSVLAFCDLIYIISSIVIFGIPNIFTGLGSTSHYKHLVPILLPLAQIGLTGSIYLTLAIAVERYATVCHPFFKVSKSWSSLLYILPILSFAIIYNLPKFCELHVVTEEMVGNSSDGGESDGWQISDGEEDLSDIFSDKHNTTKSLVFENRSTFPHPFLIEKIAPTSLRLNPLYIKVYLIYLNLFIHGIIPFILLIVLNISIYRQIRRLRHPHTDGATLHQAEIRLTQISVGIAAVFIGCHAVKWIPNIWELAQVGDNATELSWPAWLSYVTCLSHLLTTFNCSVNFYIYSIKHSKRERVRRFSTTEITNLVNSKEDVTITKTELRGQSGFRDNTVYTFNKL